MQYEMEELLPIVAELIEKHTGLESTSVTYEKARALMNGVLYCIQEQETQSHALMHASMSAREAYENGRRMVLEKVRDALALYNDLMQDFCDYGNACLRDTVQKGMPEFFKWYDPAFAPQETILTLDYPILKDLSHASGIDRIYEYLLCIRCEQKFLQSFPSAYVINTLQAHNTHYKSAIENLCESFLLALAMDGLTKESLISFLEKNFDSDEQLQWYLNMVMDDVIVRVRTIQKMKKREGE